MDKKQILIYSGIAVVSAGTGFAVGHILAKKKYSAIAEEEIESVKAAYAASAQNANKPDISELIQSKVNDLSTKPEVLTTAEAISYNQGYNQIADDTDAETFKRVNGRVPTTQELIAMGEGIEPEDAVLLRNSYDHDDAAVFERNIFDDPIPPESEDPDEEGEAEVPPPSLESPYLINPVQFFTNDTNFSQVSLTYWADDEVLADSRNQIVDKNIVGEVNLHRFGTLSEDPDIVYVRSHVEKTDFEVTKVEDNYSHKILNVPEEDEQPVKGRKMRGDDE